MNLQTVVYVRTTQQIIKNWSAIIRINIEGKSLIMKSNPDPLSFKGNY